MTNEKRSTYETISSYLAAATATAIQTTGTHPMDTASKRLQDGPNIKFSFMNAQQSIKNLYITIFPKPQSSLWSGYSAALTYRVIACTSSLGTQPLLQKHLHKEYGSKIKILTGEQYLLTATHMLSAAACGLIEVVFLPLDRWKLLRQLGNKTAFFSLLKHEKERLYDGSVITGVRNIKAFSTLYGISAMSQQFIASGSPTGTLPFYQNVIVSCAGAIGAVIVSNPTDVVKTRLQNTLEKSDSAIKITARIYKQDGMYGFMRGVVPRLMGIVPRLTFLKTATEALVPLINKSLDESIERFSRK